MPSGRQSTARCGRPGEGVDTVESNARYYRRRAVEERMAAQRAVTEQARAWHAKLAEDFARRAADCAGACTIPAATSATAVSA